MKRALGAAAAAWLFLTAACPSVIAVDVPPARDLSGHTGTRRLSPAEVEQSVRDLLREFGAADDALVDIPMPAPDHRHGFENTIDTGNFSSAELSSLLDWAESISALATTENLEASVGCSPGAAFDACAEGFTRRLLEAAWRIPLSELSRADAATVWEAAANSAVAADTAGVDAVRAIWELALVAPGFWYLSAETDASGRLLTSSIAAHLSYGLWGTLPDQALRARVAELATDEGVRAVAADMLDDPRADATLVRFHRDWLNVKSASSLDKDSALYPDFDAALGNDFEVEFDAFVLRGLHDDLTIADLFASSEGFVNPRLESFFELEPRDAAADDFVWRDLGPARAGPLTRPLVLATNAGRGESALIQRGVAVIEHLFCAHLTVPDNAIAEALPIPPDASSGKLAAVADRASKPNCAVCHTTIDPIGVAFEVFDAVGARRSVYPDGIDIPVGGVLDTWFLSSPIAYDHAGDLLQGLAAAPEVRRCYASKWSEWLTGVRPDGDRLDAIGGMADDTALSLREIVLRTVTSPWFLTRAAEKVQP
jgi:hypothetical protein